MIDRAGLTTAAVLQEVDHARQMERTGRNQKLIMATIWADHHPTESINPNELLIPGGDRPLRLGGDGTPAIAGFATAEFAVHLHKSRRFAETMIGDALDLRHRFPRLWTRLCAGEVDGDDCQHVARETRHLTQAQAEQIDHQLADRVGRLSWAALLRQLHALIIEVDAENIARMAEQHLSRTGVFPGPVEDGYQSLEIRGDAAWMRWYHLMINRLAGILLQKGDERPLGERQIAAARLMTNPLQHLQLLAEDAEPTLFDDDPDGLIGHDTTNDSFPYPPVPDPPTKPDDSESDESGTPESERSEAEAEASEERADTRQFPRVETDRELARQAIAAITQLDPAKLRPDATLYVHIAAETLQAGLGVTRVEDIGPVINTLVGQWLQTCDVTVKPVIDLNLDNIPVDAYEIPRAMRERMFLKQPASVFPYSTASNRRQDLDHTAPYRNAVLGQTREDNLGPLARREHNLITHGHWQRRQPEPGTFLFRAPHGKVLLVNGSGTTDLGQDHLAHLIWHATTPEHRTA